ncbi:MAG: ABC transporter permease [Chloroflexi bacterium]|nr:ABC transporter permease [Chloroflexota bacterium]
MGLFTVARRELTSYFGSPVAYIVAAAFLALNGFLFAAVISNSQQADMSFVFGDVAIVLLFVIPGITMRLIAEEQRLGTLELLLTAPVRDWEVILGKFLAAFALFILMLVPTGLYVVFLVAFGHPDLSTILSGYIGIVLLGAAFIGFGLVTSALTQSQLVAFIVAFVLGLILWLLQGLAVTFSGGVASVVSFLGLSQHVSNFSSGLVQSDDVVYLLSLIVCSLFVATRILESRRYR